MPGTAALAPPEAQALLDAWARAVAPGDPAAFARRLEWDGQDEAGVRRALLAPAPPAATAPDWTRWLERFLEAEDGSPFGPFVATARRALAATGAVGDGIDGAWLAFERRLVADLAAIGEAALRRQDEDGLAGVFKSFPVLARHLALVVSTWVESTAELRSRLRDDRDSIARFFGVPDPGALRDASPGLSDRHHGGRSVSTLTFASGLRLVYKPRDVGLEDAFQRFQSWLSERGLRSLPPAMRVLARDGYGWVEHVAPEAFHSPDEVARYFHRAGALLAVIHFLRAGDAHQENVVATRSGPRLVDAEMLLQPVDHREATDARADGFIEGGAYGIPRSCLSSGFVTLVDVDGDGVAHDVGGLRPAPPDAGLHNDVVLDGVVQAPEPHGAEVAAGFADAYRFLLAERAAILDPAGPLSSFAPTRARILFRPTGHYGAFLAALRAPRHQRRGLDRSITLEMLNRVFAEQAARPRLWPLVAEESSALESLDVPHFLQPVTGTDVVAKGGVRVGGHFVRAGLDAVADGLRAMSEADLRRQIALLESALEADVTPTGGATPDPGEDPESLWIRAAAILGDRIVGRGHRATDGSLAWGDPVDLYRGQAGVALFLAALAAVTGADRFHAAARDALRPLGTPVAAPSIGACSGTGSVVYALATASRLTGDDAWMKAARRWAREITPERIAGDRHLDVAGGAAGALLALLAIDARDDPSVRERIDACARRLAKAPLSRAGFAHGAAGIAYALARAFAVTGDSALLEAVRRAHDHERSLFSAAAGNWPTAHEGGTLLMTAWCNGAPGIGLARALEPDASRDDLARHEIAVAIRTTAMAPRGRTDHLCCGVMGRAEALLVMGSRTGDDDAIAAARAAATGAATAIGVDGGRSLRTEGFEHRTFQPGFFRGLAGIGYQLLRTAAPGRLPSVLGFEGGTPP